MARASIERTLERNGMSFRYRRIGGRARDFAPTLFVSGAFQTMDSWSRFARVFHERTTVILVDPPGMGSSSVLPPDVGVNFLAECLRMVIDDAGCDVVNVIAASYGTPAAHRLAQIAPETIDKVVLVGTMKAIPDAMRERIRTSIDLALRGDRKGLAAVVVDGLLCRDLGLPIMRRDLAARVLAGEIIRMSDHALRQYATNSTRLLDHCPLDLTDVVDGPEALVFTGEHDCFTPPASCLDVAHGFRRGWFTVVEQADHLVHIERFDVVISLLLRFMDGRVEEPAKGCAPVRPVVGVSRSIRPI